MAFGDALHLKINMAGCNRNLLSNLDKVKEYLDTTPDFIDMTLIQASSPIWYEDANPEFSGITGTSILATSHIAVHTFPARGFMYADLFSCCPFSVQDALSMTLDFFEPLEYKHWVTDRSDLFNWCEPKNHELMLARMNLIGVPTAFAIELIESHDFIHRFRSIEGTVMIGTRDLNVNRVNLTVVFGKITEAYLG